MFRHQTLYPNRIGYVLLAGVATEVLNQSFIVGEILRGHEVLHELLFEVVGHSPELAEPIIRVKLSVVLEMEHFHDLLEPVQPHRV